MKIIMLSWELSMGKRFVNIVFQDICHLINKTMTNELFLVKL